MAEPARRWWAATVVLTVLPVLLTILLAPGEGASRSTALVWLLFVGSSVHIGATAWFYTVPEVRGHMATSPARYYAVPAVLVLAGMVASVVLNQAAMTWLLLAFFAWQFFHVGKQNLGVAALAARSVGAGGLAPTERFAITSAASGGILGLLGHPGLLGLRPSSHLGVLAPLGLAVFLGSALVGAVAAGRRPRIDRPAPFVVVYAISVLFFAPVFLFDSPYAAVAGITIAHGLQYLLLVGLVASAPTGHTAPAIGVLVLVNVALVLGILLNQASHLHDGDALARAGYGAYLGVLMAHFVVDAGLWRLREAFPREFLSRRLPYLLVP